MAQVTAVARYQVTALVRGHRWVPPLLLLGLVLSTATAGGPPPGDALAFGGAALVPVCAWITRLVLVADPAAARACLMAAAGPVRTQLGSLLAALVASVSVCLAATLTVGGLVLAARGSSGVAAVAATVASGFVSGLACSLIGVALGAVSNPPVLRRADASVAVTATGVTIALTFAGSPAYAALSDLSRTPAADAAPAAWVPLAVAAGLLALAAAASARTALRRGVQ